MQQKFEVDRTSLLLVVLSLGACAVLTPPMPEPTSPEYGEVKVVRVQLCEPNKEVIFEDVKVDLRGLPEAETFERWQKSVHHAEPRRGWPFKSKPVAVQGDWGTARRWLEDVGSNPVKTKDLTVFNVLNRDGTVSYGGDWYRLNGSTLKNQPIYEDTFFITRRRVKDYVALSYKEKQKENAMEFWYKLPEDIPVGSFSAWQKPTTQQKSDEPSARKDNAFRLTHGMDWIAGAVTASDTPKIRAMQISIEDLFNERRLWWRIEEADKTRYSAQSGYFISSDPEKIPACD